MTTIILTFLTTFFDNFKKFLFTKNGIIALMTLILCFSFYIIYLKNQFIEVQKIEIVRTKTNFLNADFKLDSIITESGKLAYSANTLLVTNRELEKTNFDLYKDIENLKIKLKNVTGVVKPQIEYVYVQKPEDSVNISQKSDSVFLAIIENPWIRITEKIHLVTVNDKKIVGLSNVTCKITDSLLIAHETIYKKKWIFWKKEIGVKTYVSSNNPYFRVNKIESYLFKK